MSARQSPPRRRWLALALSGALGAAAALLVSCGSSGKLIPVANSEPLQADFEEVARDAEAAHGDCGATEASVRKAEHDLAALPSRVDAGLRRRLGEGLNRLRTDALELCAMPSTQSTATTAPHTTSTSTTQTSTTPTTQTTPTTPTTPPTSTAPGGGTPAKEAEEEPSGEKHHKEKDEGPSGGAAAEGGGK